MARFSSLERISVNKKQVFGVLEVLRVLGVLEVLGVLGGPGPLC